MKKPNDSAHHWCQVPCIEFPEGKHRIVLHALVSEVSFVKFSGGGERSEECRGNRLRSFRLGKRDTLVARGITSPSANAAERRAKNGATKVQFFRDEPEIAVHHRKGRMTYWHQVRRRNGGIVISETSIVAHLHPGTAPAKITEEKE